MGGNLFKLGRLAKEDYKKLETKLQVYLDEKLGEHYRIPRYYDDKPDFGDMDIIVSSAAIKKNWQNLKQEIVDDLGIETHKSIGNVFSTIYDDFQVDYFVRDEQYFHSAWCFLSFNDIGNLIGRICKRFNLKYGERGLAYVYRRAEGNYNKDLALSTDFKDIFSFLKLDYSKWEQGFTSKKEMFDWLVICPYFSVKPYQKLSKSLEKRLRERPTIQAFINYLEENKIDKVYDFYEDQDAYIPLIAQHFPTANLETAIEKERKREAFVQVIREKYNGRLIMALFPSLKNKALGQFMEAFKQSFDDFETQIHALTAKEIEQKLQTFYKNYQRQ